METQAFTDYYKSKQDPITGEFYKSESEWMQSIINRYQGVGELQGSGVAVQYKAQCEMVANFVGDCLFGDNSSITENLLAQMPDKSRKGFVAWVTKFLAKLKQTFAKKPQLNDIQRLEQRFLETAAVAAESRTAENKKTTTEGGESSAYSINQNFNSEFDSWDKKDTNKIFTIGTTSEALKSVNIKNQEIKMRSGMILQKLKKHPEMSMDIFKKIPELLENPIIIQFSDAIDPNTGKPKYESRITVLGELYASMVIDGKTVQKPVLVSLELLPTNQKKTKILDVSFVTSAYTKDALQQYINDNSILYIDPNKKRTNKWLSLNRLSLPLGENQTGPIRRITYVDGKVKIQNSRNATGMQQALEKAGVIDSYGNSILDESQNDTSDNESFSLPENQSANVEYSLPPVASGSHGAENLHDTPDRLKPTSEREWSAFNRQFANKTNGLKSGKKTNIMIYTADYAYFVSADGYMSGKIVKKVISKRKLLHKLRLGGIYMVTVTPAQQYLIKWLKVMKVKEDEAIGIMMLMDTAKKRDDLMKWMSNNSKATPSEILGKALEISKLTNTKTKSPGQ